MIRSEAVGNPSPWPPRLALLVTFLVITLAMSCSAKSVTSTSPGPTGAALTPTGTPKPAKLTFSIFGPTWNTIERLVAQKKGFFAAENLTVDEVVAGGAAPICQ
jgi:hypothetical protein